MQQRKRSEREVMMGIDATGTKRPLAVDSSGKLRIEQTRTYVDFSITVSGEIIPSPGAGYKLRVFDVFWSSNADIVSSIRFGVGGSDMWAIQAKGVMSKNLIGRERDSAENKNLYGYLSGAGVMKGTIGYEVVSV